MQTKKTVTKKMRMKIRRKKNYEERKEDDD